MKRLIFTLIFMLYSLTSNASRYDAYFLDRMVDLNQLSSKMSELAQKKSTNPELKRLARKIIRRNHADLEKMQEWRNDKYDSIPEFWALPTKDISELTKLEGSDFDLAFLDRMIRVKEQGLERLKDAEEKGEKDFIESFSRKCIQAFKKDLKLLTNLRKQLMGQN